MTNRIMRKPRTFFYGFAILFVLITATYFFSFGLDLPNSLAQSKLRDAKKIKFINLTKSFQIAGSKIIGIDLSLLLKNNYDKSINGFYVTEGSEEATVTNVELIYSDIRTEIAPGETYTFLNGAGEKLFTEGLTINAVMFTDGSGDGDPEIIQRIRDVRQGEKVQIEKGLEFLRNSSLTEDLQSKMARLRTDISDLTTKDERKSTDYNAGLSYGKQRLMIYLKEIEKSVESNKTNSEFLRIQEKLERVVTKL